MWIAPPWPTLRSGGRLPDVPYVVRYIDPVIADPVTASPLVRRHHWIVIVTHWATVILLAGMITSGLQIYEAYARFGNRGAASLPNAFEGTQFPASMRLGGWLAGGLNWHFALMWPFVLFGVLYVSYLVGSGEWRSLLFRPSDVPGAIEMTKYYLRLRRDHPAQGKHNPLQKLAYTSVILLGGLAVLTGVAIYKPLQFSWLTALFGGFQAARYWHFWVVWIFVAFSVVHVLLVFLVDPPSLRAMLSGKYRGRFPSHG
jgi:thiosulfate reductase cytochrome b subunit